jgi:glycosyltransferase involved in cell wall biosynthesis
VRPGRDLALAPVVPLPPPEGLGRLVLGCWGGVHWLKGADIVLEALALLAREGGLPVELHIAGAEVDAAFSARLRELAASAAPSGGLSVHFHGRYPEGGLACHPVTAVHAMVSGTRAHETWGLVLDEALSFHLPMVLPRAGAYPEHLGLAPGSTESGEQRGVLFYTSGDPASLAAALARLRSERGLLGALRRALPPLHEVLPTQRQHVEAMLACYREAVAAGAPELPRCDVEAADAEAIAREAAWDGQLARHTAEELGLA